MAYLTCLGMTEVDRFGNVNVSRFCTQACGRGRVHQHQPERTATGLRGNPHRRSLEVSIEVGRVRILTEGRQRKFDEAVEQITFSGPLAASNGQSVLYVIERWVSTSLPKVLG